MPVLINRKRARSALATVELLMSLPLLAVLFLILLTLSAGGLMKFDMLINARNEAWSKRDAIATKLPIGFKVSGGATRSVSKIFDTERMSSPAAIELLSAGKVESQKNERLMFGFAPILEALPNIQGRCTLMNGSWDRREIPFERESYHSQLRFDQRIRAFTSSHFDITVFESLIPIR